MDRAERREPSSHFPPSTPPFPPPPHPAPGRGCGAGFASGAAVGPGGGGGRGGMGVAMFAPRRACFCLLPVENPLIGGDMKAEKRSEEREFLEERFWAGGAGLGRREALQVPSSSSSSSSSPGARSQRPGGITSAGMQERPSAGWAARVGLVTRSCKTLLNCRAEGKDAARKFW